MCGITGIIDHDGRIDTLEKRLLSSIASLNHRGPDDNGSWLKGSVGLGHTRLSILDLSEAASQPMVSEGSKFVIVYNGETYNYKELWSEFGDGPLNSSGDTEVILKLYSCLGDSLWPKLNGMFGLALLDRDAEKLHLVRDRAGIKPLYYFHDGKTFAFASEIKAIEALVEPKFNVNRNAVHEWTYFGAALGVHTLTGEIKKVLPGQRLTFDLTTGQVATNKYWTPTTKVRHASTLNQAKSLQDVLETAVKRQLVSDVPVGVFLSGGIDSSCLAAFAAKHYGKQLSTFSVSFDYENDNNELPVARKFAKQLGTDHHEMRIEGRELAPIVRKMVVHHDSPFSDAANIPLYLLCESVKDQIKVVLQGDGGDELFAGYKRYNTLSSLLKWKGAARVQSLTSKLQLKNKAYYRRRRYSNALLKKGRAALFAGLLTVEDEMEVPQRMFGKALRSAIENTPWTDRYNKVAEKYQGEDLVKAMLMVDFEIILPDIFLEKVDKSTMAASVEVRVPFLDNEVIAFAHGLTSSSLTKDGEQKWLLKKALEGIVPNHILYGRKRGFGVPFGDWVKRELKELFWDEVYTLKKREPGVLNIEQIEHTYKAHSSNAKDEGFWLWKVMNFAIWCNESQVRFN